MNLTPNVIAQLKVIRSQVEAPVDAQIDSLIDLLETRPGPGSASARVPAKGKQCPHCGVSNPKRETAGGFGHGEEKTYCGNCGKEF